MGTSKKGFDRTISDDDNDSSDSSFTDSDSDTSTSEPNDADTTVEEAPQAEEEQEDEVIRAIRAENERERDHPPTIHCDEFVVDICFHPKDDLLAVASITGDVAFYRYGNEENALLRSLELHTEACRDVEFSDDGALMYSVSKDRNVMVTDVESGKLAAFYDEAHDEPIYCVSVLDENLFATGDDDGTLKLWDRRVRDKAIFKIKKNDDYISDIITNDAQKYLLYSSGDGLLTTLDLQQRKFLMQSEEYEEELTCLGLFKSGQKLLAGSSKGNLILFNWHEFGLHSDLYPGPKASINSLIPITENIVVTAFEDGVLRAVHLFPHRYLGVVGQHELSVENLDICNSGKFIASSCHNNYIKFWNIQYFEDFEKVSSKHNKHNKRKEMHNNLPSSKRQNVADFFSDLT